MNPCSLTSARGCFSSLLRGGSCLRTDSPAALILPLTSSNLFSLADFEPARVNIPPELTFLSKPSCIPSEPLTPDFFEFPEFVTRVPFPSGLISGADHWTASRLYSSFPVKMLIHGSLFYHAFVHSSTFCSSFLFNVFPGQLS